MYSPIDINTALQSKDSILFHCLASSSLCVLIPEHSLVLLSHLVLLEFFFHHHTGGESSINMKLHQRARSTPGPRLRAKTCWLRMWECWFGDEGAMKVEPHTVIHLSPLCLCSNHTAEFVFASLLFQRVKSAVDCGFSNQTNVTEVSASRDPSRASFSKFVPFSDTRKMHQIKFNQRPSSFFISLPTVKTN